MAYTQDRWQELYMQAERLLMLTSCLVSCNHFRMYVWQLTRYRDGLSTIIASKF